MNTDALRNIVSKVAPVDDALWEVSKQVLQYRELKKKEYFVRQGETCRYVGFIHTGYTRLFYNVDGVDITKDFNMEYSFCGSYASFIKGTPARFNVIAMEPMQLQTITRTNLLQLADAYMAWQKFLRVAMENMFISKENREAMFLLSTPEQRYAGLLQEHPDWINRVPLRYLASYLNITPETLSRIRARMART